MWKFGCNLNFFIWNFSINASLHLKKFWNFYSDIGIAIILKYVRDFAFLSIHVTVCYMFLCFLISYGYKKDLNLFRFMCINIENLMSATNFFIFKYFLYNAKVVKIIWNSWKSMFFFSSFRKLKMLIDDYASLEQWHKCYYLHLCPSRRNHAWIMFLK